MEKSEKAFRVASNAIYFDDNSDYKSALYEICKALKPELEDEIGKKYMEEE